MGLFDTLLDKLGLSRPAQTPAPTAGPAEAVAPAAPAPAVTARPAPAPAAEVVNPIAMVDVVALLEKRAAAHPQKLNWRTSIVDLLKLLDMDSSLQARKALAKELYCPDELMNDSASMNLWLHKNVLGHVAAHGGKVPKELLD